MPTIRVNDINMYYETSGEGEPLVLIPGLASDVSDYAAIIAGLAKSYQVIALDNRGAGRTDKPDIPYSIELMADDAAGLLTALGVKQAHIMGISMGGRIAADLALRHPEHVKGLILVSTSMKPPAQTKWRFFLLNVMPRLSLFRGSRKYPQPYYAFQRQRAASRTYDSTDRLHEIHVPTLILHGRNDRTAPLWLAEEMHAGIRDSQMITFPGGHIFFVFRSQQFIDTVQGFLKTA